MKVILFNTCGAEASVALADTDRAQPTVALSVMPGRTASEHLVAKVRQVMLEARWDIKELNAIAVVTGPGSFTGVRIGLSAAKGLGEAIGAPMVAVSRLAVLAAAAGGRYRRVCALLDAGRGEFYCGQYDEDRTLLHESLLSKEDALNAALLAETAVACERAVFEPLIESLPVLLVAEPSAADALPFAMKRLSASEFDDPVKLDANYLRRTDAEIFTKPAARRAG
jgi:tRNA threonylcarbamoyladenosine biosynthesis protein TsaB